MGTFNLRQQLAIQDELELRRREDPRIELFFDRGRVEPFFVKNLENIQGDERDVIFISVTYAKGADGRLRYHFGPLNGENGWRRLNVLITSARQRMKVFSSMRGDEINAAATTSNGARLLREFLLYAERGRRESISVSLAADTESPSSVMFLMNSHGETFRCCRRWASLATVLILECLMMSCPVASSADRVRWPHVPCLGDCP